MKRTIFCTGTAGLLLAVAPVWAQAYSGGDHYGYRRGYYDAGNDQGVYVGAAAGYAIYKEDGIDTLTPPIIELRIGRQFSPYLAVEGRLGTGINNDESHGYRINVERVYGGYAKGMLPISPTFSLYGLAGVAGVRLHRNYPDFNGNEAGLSFGFGGQFKVGGGASLDLEWVRLVSGTNDRYYDFTTDQATFGVNWHW